MRTLVTIRSPSHELWARQALLGVTSRVVPLTRFFFPSRALLCAGLQDLGLRNSLGDSSGRPSQSILN